MDRGFEMNPSTDLLLVRPGDKKRIYGDLSFSLAAVEPPLWAALIGAYVRAQGFSVGIADIEAENFSLDEAVEHIENKNPLLVVFIVTGSNLSASTWKMHGAGQLAKKLKEKNTATRIMFWGLHPSSLPEKTLAEETCDFVCRGEGFQTISQLLTLLKAGHTDRFDTVPGLCFRANGKSVIVAHGPVIKNLDSLPDAAWDLLPMDKYRAHNWQSFDNIDQRSPYGVVSTSFGCPYSCSFCALHQMFGQRGIRYRSPEAVVREIDHLHAVYGIKNIKILDECFVINHDHTLRICDLLIERGHDLNLWAYARIDTVDETILLKMRAAGVRWLCYGIESGSDRILKSIAKGRFDREKIRKVISMTRRAGIYILANFMFGFEEDDYDSMNETLEFAKELNCEYSNFYSVMAYPGSQLYETALKTGLLLPETWLGYSQYSEEALPLSTRYLTGGQVLKFRDDAFNDFHRNDRYLQHLAATFGEGIAKHMKDLTESHITRRNI
jgi:radical SAM superfamily enzyme YgiQ (UPF0313 family)